MGSSSGGGGDQTTTTAPWGPQGRQLKYGFKQARSLYGGEPFTFFPGQTYANLNNDLTGAWDMTRQQAGSGMAGQTQDFLQRAMNAPDRQSFVDPIARQYMQDTAQGAYLDNNPHMDRMAELISRKVQAQANNAYAGGGRTMSGAQARGVGTAIGDSLTNLYAQNYARERGLQQGAAGNLAGLAQYDQSLSNQDFAQRMQAAGMLPMAQQMGYMDSQRLADVGKAQRAFEQQGIDEAIARHQFAQEEPWQRLERFMGIVGSGNYGGTTTTSGGGGGGGFNLGGAISGGLSGFAIGGPAAPFTAGLGALAGSGLI